LKIFAAVLHVVICGDMKEEKLDIDSMLNNLPLRLIELTKNLMQDLT